MHDFYNIEVRMVKKTNSYLAINIRHTPRLQKVITAKERLYFGNDLILFVWSMRIPNPFNDQNSDIPDDLSNQIQTAGDHDPITDPKALHNPLPLVKQAGELLEIYQPDQFGILESSSKKCLDNLGI